MPRILLLTAICILAAPLYAQPQLSGPQSGTLGPGTYLVVGEISVVSGNSLTIAPGTTFLHNGNHKWLISGQFTAEGTVEDSILFVRQNPISDHQWGGLHFIDGAQAANLDYCVIDHCLLGFSMDYFASINVYSGGLGLSLRHCRVTNANMYFYGGAVYVNNASVLIDSCMISSNYLANNPRGLSVYLVDCSNAELLNSQFGHNQSSLGGT